MQFKQSKRKKDNSQDKENQKSTQEKINCDKTRIDESDDESEVNEDIPKPTVYNSKKLTSTNNSFKQMKIPPRWKS